MKDLCGVKLGLDFKPFGLELELSEIFLAGPGGIDSCSVNFGMSVCIKCVENDLYIFEVMDTGTFFSCFPKGHGTLKDLVKEYAHTSFSP